MQKNIANNLKLQNRKRIFEHAFMLSRGRLPNENDCNKFRDFLECDNFSLHDLLNSLKSEGYADRSKVEYKNDYLHTSADSPLPRSILVLCTYPIANPTHGGQLRVRNIVDKYKSCGIQVEVAGVLGSSQYPAEVGFVACPSVNELAKVIQNPFLMEDYAIGKLFATADGYYGELVKQIKYSPDIIEVEHPWLFEFALRYKREYAPQANIIYSSHNVEFQLKFQILSMYLDQNASKIGSELVKEVELYATIHADAVICVSDKDSNWLRARTTKDVVIAPNGVSPWVADNNSHEEAVRISQGHKYALYCASAHPPNMAGFFEMLGGGFGSMNPDQKLVIAGDAGWSIAGDQRVHQSAKLAEKVIVAGRVDKSTLAGLLDSSHCIILPLTHGGGTNLKTAEALWSGKHIVATSLAMRGFESFIGQNGVRVADTSVSFKRAIREVMNSPPLELSSAEFESRLIVTWEHSLKSLSSLVKSVFNSNIRGGC